MVLSSSKTEADKEELPSYWASSPFSEAVEKLLKLNFIVQDATVFSPTESKLRVLEEWGMIWGRQGLWCPTWRGEASMIYIPVSGCAWRGSRKAGSLSFLCPGPMAAQGHWMQPVGPISGHCRAFKGDLGVCFLFCSGCSGLYPDRCKKD